MKSEFFDLVRKVEPESVNFRRFFMWWALAGLCALAFNAGLFVAACYIVKWIFF